MSQSSRQIIKEAGGSAVFSNVVVTGNLVYLAGVIGQKDGKLVPGGIEAETPAAFEVAKERLATVGLDLSDGEPCRCFADISR
jgi:enamine deaminase RidA (YjgF/YER057c/UK114 family)